MRFEFVFCTPWETGKTVKPYPPRISVACTRWYSPTFWNRFLRPFQTRFPPVESLHCSGTAIPDSLSNLVQVSHGTQLIDIIRPAEISPTNKEHDDKSSRNIVILSPSHPSGGGCCLLRVFDLRLNQQNPRQRTERTRGQVPDYNERRRNSAENANSRRLRLHDAPHSVLPPFPHRKDAQHDNEAPHSLVSRFSNTVIYIYGVSQTEQNQNQQLTTKRLGLNRYALVVDDSRLRNCRKRFHAIPTPELPICRDTGYTSAVASQRSSAALPPSSSRCFPEKVVIYRPTVSTAADHTRYSP